MLLLLPPLKHCLSAVLLPLLPLPLLLPLLPLPPLLLPPSKHCVSPCGAQPCGQHRYRVHDAIVNMMIDLGPPKPAAVRRALVVGEHLSPENTCHQFSLPFLVKNTCRQLHCLSMRHEEHVSSYALPFIVVPPSKARASPPSAGRRLHRAAGGWVGRDADPHPLSPQVTASNSEERGAGSEE